MRNIVSWNWNNHHINLLALKKYIVLSVNWNPDYLFYTPLCCWAWKKFGWFPVVFYQGETTPATLLALDKSTPFLYEEAKDIDGYRSDTITQTSRLYGACVADGYLMTGDIDMIPLSDFWKPNEDEITVYGYDLTDFTQVPICYVGMTSQRWIEIMGITSKDYNALIKRDLSSMPEAHESQPWEKRWGVDQQLLTKRIMETQFKKTFINRGKLPNGYARGRVDRGAWSLDHPEFIDAHLLRDMYKKSDTGAMNFAKTMRLLERIWPEEDFTWFREYTTQFQILANNG